MACGLDGTRRAGVEGMGRAILLLVAAVLAAPPPAGVATRMRNVLLHVGNGVELRVDDLAGRLVSTTNRPPLFDDVRSYTVEIDYGRVAMTAASLTNLLNHHVFAYDGAPVGRMKVAIQNGMLVQSGVLKKGVSIPFTMRATIAATADGKIRIHPASLKAAGFLSKRVLDFFGVDLESLVKVNAERGVTVDGDDLLLDPERLLPPPRIHGRLTKAWIAGGLVYEQFGTPPKRPLEPPRRAGNYMYYRGGVLRFGKLTMDDTDLLLVDADQRDAFDFSPEGYKAQLIAGYSKNTASGGLVVYMPDLRALHAARNDRAHNQPSERQHHQ